MGGKLPSLVDEFSLARAACVGFRSGERKEMYKRIGDSMGSNLLFENAFAKCEYEGFDMMAERVWLLDCCCPP